MSEKKSVTGFNWGTFALSLLIIAMGVLFIVFSDDVGGIICTILGIFMFVGAVALIINLFINKKHDKNIAGVITLALLMVVFGIFCLTNSTDMEKLIQIFFAAVIIYNGLSAIVDGVSRLRAKAKGGVIILIMGVVLLALGCVVLFGKFGFVATLTGISLIVDGIALALMTIMLKPQVQATVIETKE